MAWKKGLVCSSVLVLLVVMINITRARHQEIIDLVFLIYMNKIDILNSWDRIL